jgi:ribosomal protein S18 acetylase RimI-like enzyme
MRGVSRKHILTSKIDIREIKQSEYTFLGELMVDVYSKLEGFPSPSEQPDYYKMLGKVGNLNEQEHTTVLVAESSEREIVGGVVYYDDMSKYGSGGTATQEKNASGIRLLCVNPKSRGIGVGKALTNECIRLAKASGNKQVILHTTQAMEIAWSIYLKIGFERSIDLDFSQEGFPIFGFRLMLANG